MVRDITLRRRAEEEVQRREKLDAVGRVVGGVAHDFNSLLAIIHGNAELLLGSSSTREEEARLARQIQQASSRAAALVRRLLAFGNMQVHRPGPLALNDLVAQPLPLLRRLLGEGITLEGEFASGLDPVHADAGQVEQVLLNLVLNARDAMPGAGAVRICTAVVDLEQDHPEGLPAGRYATIQVCDSGCGMDEATMARAKEPFFTTNGHGRSTGLGLSTVVDILRQHRGGLTLESSPGRGTRATAWLPVMGARQPALREQPEPPPPRGPEIVLLVDDEPVLREVLKRGLSRGGYGVIQAGSAEEALEVLRDHEVDVVVTDVVMPGLSGLELVEELARTHPGLPAILITGYTDRVPDDLCRNVPLLVKPFRLGELLLALRRALDARAAGG